VMAKSPVRITLTVALRLAADLPLGDEQAVAHAKVRHLYR